MLDSLVRVSRRAAYNHYASILAEARSSIWAGCIAKQAITLPERSYIPEFFIQPPKPILAWLAEECTRPESLDEQLQAGLIASASLSTISRTF